MSVLLAKLMRIEKDPVNQLDNIKDVMHLGESYFNRKQYDKAEECLEAVIHTHTDTLTLYGAMKYLSLICKHNKDWDKATYYWFKMDRVNIGAVFPLIELAKYYEHTAGDIEKALSCAQKAKTIIYKSKNKEQMADIDIRLRRLNKKSRKR